MVVEKVYIAQDGGGGDQDCACQPYPARLSGLYFMGENHKAASRGSVLLLHGYGGSGAEVAGLAISLAERRFDVLCPDLPGHGETGGVLEYDSALAACVACCHWLARRAMARQQSDYKHLVRSDCGDTAQFREGIRPSIAMVGFSLGARLALACARIMENGGPTYKAEARGQGQRHIPHVHVPGVVLISPPGRAILLSRLTRLSRSVINTNSNQEPGGADRAHQRTGGGLVGDDKSAVFMFLRKQRVRERAPFEGLNGILERLGPDLGPVDQEQNRLVLYGSEDLSSVRKAVAGLKISCLVDGASHLDIITSPMVLNHVPSWLAERMGGSPVTTAMAHYRCCNG